MHFLLLLFLLPACAPEAWGPVEWIGSPARGAALTWLSTLAVVALAGVLANWTSRELVQHPDQRHAVARRYSRYRLLHLGLLLTAYLISLFSFGWGWEVEQLVCGPIARATQGFLGLDWSQQALEGKLLLPGAELLVLAPFLAALVGTWTCLYDAERALHQNGDEDERGDEFWSRSGYVNFHVRFNLALVFIPVLLLIVQKAIHWVLPDSIGGMASMGVAILGTLAVFAIMPWLLRLILSLQPLPAGPLREQLEATAHRLRFRCSDILLWKTRNNVANAMVTGVLPRLRYVLLTDRLVADLTPQEIDAVFGHEVGHVKHHHLPFYLGFLMVSLTVVGGIALLVIGTLESQFQGLKFDHVEQGLAMLPLVALMGPYIFLVFGFLSRRCERQADLYGCRAVSCDRPDCEGHGSEDVHCVPGKPGLCPTGVRTFISALEKVARLNGISRDKPGWLQSWQHSTIARRVEFLQRVRADLTLERRFQRRVAFVKWGLVVGLAVVFLMVLLLGRDRLLEDPKPDTQSIPAGQTMVAQ